MKLEKVEVEKVLISNKESHTPVLLNFQNGTLNKDSIDSVGYFETINQISKERTAVLTTLGGNVYNGTIDDCCSKDALTKSFIAIKNKRTNKIRLVEIEQASMINKIFNEKKVDDRTEVAAASTSENDKLSRTLLIKNFGGRKAIRSYERNERMKVNVDVVKEQLDKTIDNAEIDDTSQQDQQKQQIDIECLRPPLNADAKKIEDVYSITDIIPQDLLDRLNDECYALIETSVEAIPITSELILKRIKQIQDSQNPKSVHNLNTLKACLYMDALLNLIKTRQRVMDRMELSKITEKIENHIRENFSDPNLKTRMKTKNTTDKALCYFITLALLIHDNYEIDLDILSQELSIAKTKILKYARIVNSTAKYGTNILRLQLPGKVKISSFIRKQRTK